ncbi:MAG: S-layer homology domain-containing protein, partial [Dethiosulfatibacter sp.]|nr:S-layer homology domain-containing protein [Dethiosulfatibacter sp.]
YAFSNCNILESVHLPKVTSFGTSTFNGTNNIDSLILGEVPPTVGGWGTLQQSPTRAVYVPAVAKATYDSATPPSDDNKWEGWLIETFELYGVVSINHDGTPQYGETLTANTSGITNNSGDLNYQWKRGSMNIGSNSASYTIVEADIGESLTVEVTSSVKSGTLVSSQVTPDKADYTGLIVDPAEESKTHNSITLTYINGYEYRESSGIWQDSNIFAGLNEATQYTFYQRVKETATHNQSNESNSLDITTDMAPVIPNTKSMTSYSPVTLTQTGDIANNNVQYQTANEVVSALPTDITVTLEDGSTASVPVSWTDTDNYDAITAGNYTFTATWGTLPSGVDNDDDISAPTCAIKVVKGSTGSGSSSNNSGSSGNNGRTSSDTPTPAYQVDVSSIETPSKKLSVNVDPNTGNAEVDLGSIASNIFGKEGINVVTMPSIPNVTDYTLRFPTVNESTPQGQSALTFSTELGSITMTDNMFSNIPGIEGKKPSITIGQGNKANLSEEEREAIGDRPLVQLTLSLDGKQARWNNPEAPVTVSIPYKPTDAELLDPEHIVIWYIDGQGKVISVPSGRYNSTTGTVTFDTTHFSYYAVAYAKKTFSDLNGVEWARKPIEVMASKGIINGTSTTTFSPSENITRADYLVLLINTLGLTADFDSNFDDVTPRDYYYEALGIAKELGISAGIGNNHFNPKGNISRQDMIVMTARALEKFQDLKIIKDTTVLDRFIDKEEISSYAIESLATMVKEGLISGSGNKLKPIDYSTRAEAAVFLYRIYNK